MIKGDFMKQYNILISYNHCFLQMVKIYHQNIVIVFLIVVSIIIFILLNENKKKVGEYRKKYEELLEKFKQKELEHRIDSTNDTVARNEMAYIISSETEQRILKKLDRFESSEKFLKKGISIGYLSNNFNTNPKYLSDIIKKYKGRNFNAYINSLRINYIVHHLSINSKYSEYKISYLAEECGYASSQVFVLAFKKEKGVTPSDFISKLNMDFLKQSEVI